MSYPVVRMRRLRYHPGVRDMIRETCLRPQQLVLPVFVCPGEKIKQPIETMPGQYRWSADMLVYEAQEAEALGIGGLLLFGIPESKDAKGSSAWAKTGIVQRAIEKVKKACPHLPVITDVCLCQYTDHGHCGLLRNGSVDNDESIDLLATIALSHASAGADVVAPSDMMDGRVGAIRRTLDQAGFSHIPIMAYSVKYASSLYAPFREAASSAPRQGDRRSYQIDPANRREALREVALDLKEGADIVMVKPALPYLDVISAVRQSCQVPLAAYQVSGEYAMIKVAALQGWLDEREALRETLTAIRRAGADIVITYFAKEAAECL